MRGVVVFRRLAVGSRRPRPLQSSIGPGPSQQEKRQSYPSMPCWSCEQVFNPSNDLFCNGCAKLQPQVKEQNYFQLFSLPVSLALDLSLLERRFQQLQKSVHPDLYASKTEAEQVIARARSAAAGEAYSTLRNPLLRARYVLAMKGVDLESHTLNDQELLMEIMEQQEALDEIAADGDRMAQKAAEFLALSKQCIRDAEDLLEKHGDGALQPVTHLIIKAQYYDKLGQDAQKMAAVASKASTNMK